MNVFLKSSQLHLEEKVIDFLMLQLFSVSPSEQNTVQTINRLN